VICYIPTKTKFDQEPSAYPIIFFPIHQIKKNRIYYVFVGGSDGYLKQYDSDGEMVNDFGKIHNGLIVDMDYIDDNLLVAESDGSIKQYSIESQSELADWGNISEYGINSIAVSGMDSLYIVDCAGKVMLYSISLRQLIKELEYNEHGVTEVIRANEKYSFKTLQAGNLQQYTNLDYVLFKDYGKCHNKTISAILIRKNYLFTADGEGCLKQWDWSTGNLVKDYGKIHDKGIFSISSFGDWLVTGDNTGTLKKFSIAKREEGEEFGKKYFDRGVRSVVVFKEKVFAVSARGSMRILDLETGEVLKDLGTVSKAAAVMLLTHSPKVF
jgi:WD40 repeat protein